MSVADPSDRHDTHSQTAGRVNGTQAPDFADQVEQFLHLAATGLPRPAIAHAFGLRDAGSNVENLIVGLLAPTPHEVGLRWQTNHWNIAQEHAATAVDRRERGWSRLLGRLGHRRRSPKEATVADTETTTVHTAEVVRYDGPLITTERVPRRGVHCR